MELSTKYACVLSRSTIERQCRTSIMLRTLHRRVGSLPQSVAPPCVRFKVSVPDAGAKRRRALRPKLSNDKFSALTVQFFDRVEHAVGPLLPPMNEQFELDRQTKDALVIRTAEKEFEIKIVLAKQQLHLTSPISGLRKYEWNAKTQRWEDEADAHDMEGLLTRDLMRLCVGVPLF